LRAGAFFVGRQLQGGLTGRARRAAAGLALVRERLLEKARRLSLAGINPLLNFAFAT
jgi:hypothetical protein